jgi:IstB-like ATP binding protein
MMAVRRDELTDTAADAAIDQACRILRLPTIRDRHGEIAAAAARQQAGYKAFLTELLSLECDDREMRRKARLVREAGFPRPKRLELSGVDLEFCRVSAGSDVAEMLVASGGLGLDAVLLQDPSQAEDLTVAGREFVLEVTDGGQAGGAFLAEPGGQGVNHAGVSLGWAGLGRGRGFGSLPGAQRLNAGAQIGVGVEEVQADSAGAGDRAEADLLLVLDELADRGLGAGRGGLPLSLRGAAQGIGPALGGGAAGLVRDRPGRCGHGLGGFAVRVTGTGPGW